MQGKDNPSQEVCYQVLSPERNNTDENGAIFTGAKGITVSGLSQGVDLFTRKTFNNTISISTDDVKPLQNHDDVRLEDGTVIENADILATRILTWGLPGIVPIETTKAGTKAPEYDQNFIGIGMTLRNGFSYPVNLDITEQMHEKPAGGVITVYIDAAQVPQEEKDKHPQSTGGGFNANVENWANEVNAEVTI